MELKLRSLFIVVVASAFLFPAEGYAKKKTVGQVLRSLKAKNQKLSLKKKKTALPSFRKQRVAPKPMYQVKPPSSRDILKDPNTDEAKLEAITDQGIKQLYRLTRQYKKSPNRGELWLRLAELYVEKAKYIEYRIQAAYDKKIERWNKRKQKGRRPRLNLRKSRDYNKKAITLYEWFIRDFPKDKKLDQAYFFLGYNYIELDQIPKGIAYYKKLTKKFPRSPYVGEAHFALGEYYFDNDKWRDAYKSFGSVLKNRRARLYTFALYKQAWCEYRMGRVKSGLKKLERVVRISRRKQAAAAGGRRKVSRIRLGNEALKDIVLFYGQVGNARRAKDYFYEIGGEKAQPLMLEKMAYFVADQGRRKDALYLFKQLLAENPTAPKAFDYQYQIVSIFSNSPSQGTYRRELFSWIDNFGPDSEWAEANRGNQKLIKDSEKLRESALRNYTLLLHKNAQNSQKRRDLQLAKRAYELYMEKFPNTAKYVEMRFFYGELLYMIKDYKNAAAQYEYVAKKNPKGKYYRLAVLNNLLSLEKMLKSEAQLQKEIGNSLEPVPFYPEEKAFIASAERYIKKFPKGKKVVEVKFKVAQLHYSHNQFDGALKQFKNIVNKHPKTRYAVFSANLILDIYNLRKDYDGLAREGVALMRNKRLRSQGFKADVRDMVEKAQFKKGQDFEIGKDYVKAGDSFAAFVKKNPKSPLVQSAAYNAGVNYERGGNMPKAIGMYQRVVTIPVRKKDRKKQKIRTKTILLLGKLYEQTAQYPKAAQQFERYARENPKDKLTPDLYYNSALIWEGERKWVKAERAYRQYYDSTRRRDRSDALFALAKISEKRRRFGTAIKRYEEYLNKGGNNPEKVVEANFRIAELKKARGLRTQAEKAYKRTIAVQRALSKRGSVGTIYAAQARFYLTKKTYKELRAIRIPKNPKRQAAAIQKKLALLTKLSNQLAQVIKFNEGNMVVASLARLGQAYEHMAAAVAKAPLPRGLNKEEMAEYKKGVDGVVKPLQAKAIENYTSAINKSFGLNFYSKWTDVALNAMGRYEPKYAPPTEQVMTSVKVDEMGVM